MINFSEADKKRFWSKVDSKDSVLCHEWKAGKFESGYGQIKINGKGLKSHRVAWMLVNGPIPEGKLVLHKCDNRPCCNVEHLYIGDMSNNNCDRHTRNPGKAGRPSKVGASGVNEIRRLYDEGVSIYEIANIFNYGIRHIRKICKGEVGQHTIELGVN